MAEEIEDRHREAEGYSGGEGGGVGRDLNVPCLEVDRGLCYVEPEVVLAVLVGGTREAVDTDLTGRHVVDLQM